MIRMRGRAGPDRRLDPFRGTTAEVSVDGEVVGHLMSVIVEAWTGSLWWKVRREAVDVLFDLPGGGDLALFYEADEWLNVVTSGLLDLNLGSTHPAELRLLSGVQHDQAVARISAIHGR